ncbi:hypothetical protein NZ47_13830 [Anaerovibrio lipolyticus]|uniref:HTH marR-type domain-containing protein n=1 Tax=Anaerovibrio lipolyticus TaxID=82374 RepID=A0A0B2JE71_9FIRM|nr:hypothetical protein NZ47_13830 [Anaerovibrio lipolyticus]
MLSFKDIPCYYLKLRWAEMLSRKFYNKRMMDCGITGRQFTLLFIIKYNGGSSLSELGDMMNLDRSTINRSIQPLLKKAYWKTAKLKVNATAVSGLRNAVKKYLTSHRNPGIRLRRILQSYTPKRSWKSSTQPWNY